MGKALQDFGLQAGQAAIGGALGMAFGRMNDRRQFKQATKLGHLQLGLDKLQTDYNFQKQLEMWKATNFSAQMAELKSAGLNPGLIYGMGGAGGATTNIEAGNVTGQHAPTGGGEPIAMMQTMAQLGLLRAQRENIEADTANKKADIPVKAATVPKITAETASITQGIQNQKAQETLTRLETELKDLQKRLQTSTFHDQEQQVHWQMEKTYKELEILRNEKLLSDEQFKDKVSLLRNQAVGQHLDNLLTQAQTNHEKQLIENAKIAWLKIYEEAKNEMWHRYISGETLNVQRRLADYKFKEGVNKEMEDEISGLISSIIGGIIGGRLGGGGSPPKIRGLHDRR